MIGPLHQFTIDQKFHPSLVEAAGPQKITPEEFAYINKRLTDAFCRVAHSPHFVLFISDELDKTVVRLIENPPDDSPLIT